MSTADEGAPLREEELRIWSAVATLLERLPTALDAQLQRDSGLTHFEFGLLFALDGAPDRALRMSILAGYASATLSRLSRAVSRLERCGLVRREPDPSDGRSTLAVLTDAGVKAVAEALPGHAALVRRAVFGSLTRAQASQLGAISERITAALDPAPRWEPPSA